MDKGQAEKHYSELSLKVKRARKLKPIVIEFKEYTELIGIIEGSILLNKMDIEITEGNLNKVIHSLLNNFEFKELYRRLKEA